MNRCEIREDLHLSFFALFTLNPSNLTGNYAAYVKE